MSFDPVFGPYEVTLRETGHSGPLFVPFIISMNLALVLVIIGVALKLA